MNNKLSVIIPSYMCKHAAKTVENLFENALGDIEVIVLLDHYEPNPPIKPHEGLRVYYNSERKGMRKSVNIGAELATGKFIMKTDDHCAFSKGFDLALIESSDDHSIIIPSRYTLDVLNWTVRHAPVSYEYMAYPYHYIDKYRYGIGLFSKKWEGKNGNDPQHRGFTEYYYREFERQSLLIDEIMIFHGSCWFTTKSHFQSIGGLSETLFNTLYQEPQELTFKTWLSGGRVLVNKNCWYAHMHKSQSTDGEPNSRGYVLDLHAMRQTESFGTWYWMNNKWPGAKYPMSLLINKFWPIPGWPDDWENQKVAFENKYQKKQITQWEQEVVLS